MNDYKPYKQLKQKQKAKVVERMYKELHQFFSDNQRFPDTPDEHELLARQIFSHIPYHVSFDEFYAVYNKKHSAIEQRLAEKGLPEHLLHREERRQEKLNRPAVKMTKPHRKKKKKQVFEPLVEQNDDFFFILMVMSGFSSCGILFSGGTQVSGQTMYSAEDRDIRGAEQDYKKLEKELDKKIKRTPTDHPGYNEYQYHLDPIEHDPWQLTSFLTTLYDDYTRSEVQGKLKETFKKQYKLTTWVEVQTRYMTVWVISPAGIPIPTQVPYEYRIFHTKLVNRGLEVVIREELDADQWKRYEIFQDTLGGRPYLFNGGLPPGGSDGSGAPGIDYTVPAEALTDSEFAAIYKEAQKYVGTPYVWGGSTPETGFDCSGYVCWVYNQNGYDVGRTTANGLWQKSQHISEAEAKPGDLVFFEGTYDTPGKSHVGIYLGKGMMVSAGDPIKYANIHSSYWEKHLAGFGRLSK